MSESAHWERLKVLSKAAGGVSEWTPPEAREMTVDGPGAASALVKAQPGTDLVYIELCCDFETAEKVIRLIRGEGQAVTNALAASMYQTGQPVDPRSTAD